MSDDDDELYFYIDTTPEPSIVEYLKSLPDTDSEEEEEEEEEYKSKEKVKSAEKKKETSKRGSLRTCWNCSEPGHSLTNCPHPRDSDAILRNRKSFLSSASKPKFRRYHEEVVLRKSGFEPQAGVVSNQLRAALGLTENQLPRHIYSMRALGYPPGWKLEAAENTSGIHMYGAHGEKVPPVDQENRNGMHIEYPGFNVMPGPGTLEESMRYRAPPMSEKYLQVNSGQEQQVKNLEPPPPGVFDGVDTTPEDMETEDIPETADLPPDDRCGFLPPLPMEELPPPPPLGTPEAPSSSRVDDKGVFKTPNSTSVPKKRKLETDSLEDSPQSKKLKTRSIAEEELGGSTKVKDSPEDLSQQEDLQTGIEEGEIRDSDEEDSSECSNQGSSEKTDQVKTPGEEVTTYTTPVWKFISPYKTLPPREAFSQGMSAVINFENLPNSTGVYAKISSVISKVRAHMQKQNQSQKQGSTPTKPD